MSLEPEDKQWIQESLDRVLNAVIGEMGIRFGEVNQRLDRMDITIKYHAKELSAGARAIGGMTEWQSKADTDYARVLAELADVKLRLSKLEAKDL